MHLVLSDQARLSIIKKRQQQRIFLPKLSTYLFSDHDA